MRNTGHHALKYNFVVVLQSLPTDEVQSGSELFVNIERLCKRRGFGCQLFDVDSKDAFFQVFDTLYLLVTEHGYIPILHIEIHGAENQLGLILKNGELITWQELASCCRKINIHLKNGLLVTLAVCYGAHFFSAIGDFQTPAPFWGCFAPEESISLGQLEGDFSSIYESFLCSDNFGEALNILYASNTRSNYFFTSCEKIFNNWLRDEVFRYPLDSPERKRKLAIRLELIYPNLLKSEIDKLVEEKIRNFDREKFFEETKRNFLMRDKI